MWDKRNRKVWRERKDILAALGHESYEEYLESDLWHKIRKRVQARDKGRCRVCRGKGSQVHHERYNLSTMLGISLGFLYLICGDCHQFLHGKKRKKRKGRRKKRRQRRGKKRLLYPPL